MISYVYLIVKDNFPFVLVARGSASAPLARGRPLQLDHLLGIDEGEFLLLRLGHDLSLIHI